MTGIYGASWLLIALPLAGAIVLLVGGRLLDRVGHLVGCATVIAAFVLGVAMFLPPCRARPPTTGCTRCRSSPGSSPGRWTSTSGCCIDPLSLTFVLLITGVGSLIHIYSIGYMAHDADRRKFFAYLNLFVAAMLLLVLGNSFVTLYAGWEGVGLASYLLIGFWSDRPSAATAAKKAFIMNRVGDVGLALAIFLMFKEMGTVVVRRGVRRHRRAGRSSRRAPSRSMALLLLLGACGKSGQVPLQAWLPDAMEGPTPVSALIHAATMVTAGVYLIARCSPIYDLTADGRLVVAIVGTVTLLVGCIAGCAKDDIKKVLAYSTVSQIGYMFLAVGLGAGVYALGILHLLTPRLLQGRAVPRRRLGHARDERRRGHAPLRRAGPQAADHLRHDDAAATWRSSASRSSPASSPRTRSSRPRSPRRGVQGVLLGFGGADRRRHHRVLHDPADDHDVLRRAAVEGAAVRRRPGLPPARVAAGDDRADDHPGHRFGRRRRVPGDRRPAGGLAGPVGRAVRAPGAAGGADRDHHRARWPWWRSACSSPTGSSAAAPVPVTAPEPVQRGRRGWPGPTSAATRSTRRWSPGPGIWLTRTLVFTDAKGVDGAVNGLAAALGGLSGRWRHWQNGFVRSYALSMFAGTLVVILLLVLVRYA